MLCRSLAGVVAYLLGLDFFGGASPRDGGLVGGLELECCLFVWNEEKNAYMLDDIMDVGALAPPPPPPAGLPPSSPSGGGHGYARGVGGGGRGEMSLLKLLLDKKHAGSGGSREERVSQWSDVSFGLKEGMVGLCGAHERVLSVRDSVADAQFDAEVDNWRWRGGEEEGAEVVVCLPLAGTAGKCTLITAS